ncbi:DUF397 domain-containing protein [Streptomyces hoynatensis]|uniref:DUF397 domain-containing protein n=1 Tax=Streptomyces hoynatensis TaxID=1141874 RepID=A0A3A9YWI2_9ACTN|nr:DUF397 domain-containing protein [Streptomyces hoynatensis]RKN40403.1 DUF397 domain-containing protein [Streptomyces hoynatensis]
MNGNPEPARAEWIKSSHSNGDGGDCVEWAPRGAARGRVAVRDSKVAGGPVLTVSAGAWAAFVRGVTH